MSRIFLAIALGMLSFNTAFAEQDDKDPEETMSPKVQGSDQDESAGGAGAGGGDAGAGPSGAPIGGGGGSGDIGDKCSSNADCGTDPQGDKLVCGPAMGCGDTPGAKCCR